VNQDTGLVLEHAWLEHACVILDPTLPDARLAYFPGLRFACRDGLAEAAALPGMLECSCGLPIFFRSGPGGHDSPAFRAAREAAVRYAGIRARGDGHRPPSRSLEGRSWQARDHGRGWNNPGDGCEAQAPGRMSRRRRHRPCRTFAGRRCRAMIGGIPITSVEAQGYPGQEGRQREPGKVARPGRG
jgi:hypothetical protein